MFFGFEYLFLPFLQRGWDSRVEPFSPWWLRWRCGQQLQRRHSHQFDDMKTLFFSLFSVLSWLDLAIMKVLDKSFWSFGGTKKKKKDTRKKKFLNSAYMNVGRRSLGICSQTFCQVFAYAVIHIVKRRTYLVLRSGAIHTLNII
jgi:hypothetical protein